MEMIVHRMQILNPKLEKAYVQLYDGKNHVLSFNAAPGDEIRINENLFGHSGIFFRNLKCKISSEEYKYEKAKTDIVVYINPPYL